MPSHKDCGRTCDEDLVLLERVLARGEEQELGQAPLLDEAQGRVVEDVGLARGHADDLASVALALPQPDAGEQAKLEIARDLAPDEEVESWAFCAKENRVEGEGEAV